MQISPRLALIVLVVALTVASVVQPVSAGPAGTLCRMNTVRGAVPQNFTVEACVDGDAIWIRNQLDLPITFTFSGDVRTPVKVSIDQSIESILTRLIRSSPNVVMPRDLVRYPIGNGPASIVAADTTAGGTYLLAKTLATYLPIKTGGEIHQALTALIVDLDDSFRQLATCLVGKNWLQQAGCRAVFVNKVVFALGLAAVTGLGTPVAQLLTGTGMFLKWADAQPGQVGSIIHSTRKLDQSSRGGVPPSGPEGPPGGSAPQDPGQQLRVSLSENPFRCDGETRPFGRVTGAVAGETITFTSPQVGGMLPGTANSQGELTIKWQCNPNESGRSWTVTAKGISSRRSATFTVTGSGSSGPAPQPQAPQPQPVPQAGQLNISLSENPFLCDGPSRGFGRLSGAAPGERITFSSPDVSGMLPGTANGNGELPLIWQCNPNEAGQSWRVTARGQSSGRTGTFTVTGRGPAQPQPQQPEPQPPPQQGTKTQMQGVKSGANTFTNYHNASGLGPKIAYMQQVEVSCKVHDPYIASVNPDGYWYRIASSPWNNSYYSPANTFFNGDPVGGPYSRNTDFSVPDC